MGDLRAGPRERRANTVRLGGARRVEWAQGALSTGGGCGEQGDARHRVCARVSVESAPWPWQAPAWPTDTAHGRRTGTGTAADTPCDPPALPGPLEGEFLSFKLRSPPYLPPRHK